MRLAFGLTLLCCGAVIREVFADPRKSPPRKGNEARFAALIVSEASQCYAGVLVRGSYLRIVEDW